MKRFLSCLCFGSLIATVPAVTGANNTEVSKPSVARQATASVSIRSGIRLHWSAASSERIEVEEEDIRRGYSRSKVTRRRSSDGAFEVIRYVDFS